MTIRAFLITCWIVQFFVGQDLQAQPATGNPADHLPAHIRQVTYFGERPDWSHDGKRILFLNKVFRRCL